jgi:hypothetical protein
LFPNCSLFCAVAAVPSEEHEPHTEEDTDERCQRQALKKLRESIYVHRHDLLFCFTQLDTDKGKHKRMSLFLLYFYKMELSLVRSGPMDFIVFCSWAFLGLS